MKCFVALAMLVLAGEALGECVHIPDNSHWRDKCDCAHRPYELFWAEKYRDGGTIKITVADSVGCAVGFTLVGAIGSTLRGRVRVMAFPPDPDGDRLAGPEEERGALDMLSIVADRYMSREEQYEAIAGRYPKRFSAEYRGYYARLLELLTIKGRR